jgi:RNA polymerase sigma-70 factor (ECF subfamily)
VVEDKLWIWKYNRGDKTVLHQIYDMYNDELVTLAAALLFDRRAAEDVVHNVFVKLIAGSAKLKLKSSFKGYLITCVVNGSRTFNKRNQRQKTVRLEEVEEIPSDDSPDRSAMFGEQARQLTRALAQLPDEQCEAIMLHTHSKMKFREIAEVQGVSINTAKGRYRYGIDKLRSLLDSGVEK